MVDDLASSSTRAFRARRYLRMIALVSGVRFSVRNFSFTNDTTVTVECAYYGVGRHYYSTPIDEGIKC